MDAGGRATQEAKAEERKLGCGRDARMVSCEPRVSTAAALPTTGRIQCIPAKPG